MNQKLRSSSRIKVKVVLYVEVDPALWAHTNGGLVDKYGNFTVASVREDVKTYVQHNIHNSPMIEDTEATVTW